MTNLFTEEDRTLTRAEKNRWTVLAWLIAVLTVGLFVVWTILNIGVLIALTAFVGGSALFFHLCVNLLPARRRLAMIERVLGREATEETGLFDGVETRDAEVEGAYFDDVVLLTADKYGRMTSPRKVHWRAGVPTPAQGAPLRVFTVGSIVVKAEEGAS
ncbi:MAG: hypothetical protein KIG36_05490 [Eubacteriales bacterium]|nr:hypothetical protein [Eubacteriales bacterium]